MCLRSKCRQHWGRSRVERDPPRLSAELGPADRLTIRWREGEGVGKAAPAVDLDQFVWLKVQPGSVVVSAKFKLRVVEGQLQQVQMAVDPRLRLLPLPGGRSADRPNWPRIGPIASAGVSLVKACLRSNGRWETTFLLSGATGVGNFRLPQIELLDTQPTRRWMALSVDPSLDRLEKKKQPLEAVAVASFLNAMEWRGTQGRRRCRRDAADAGKSAFLDVDSAGCLSASARRDRTGPSLPVRMSRKATPIKRSRSASRKTMPT